MLVVIALVGAGCSGAAAQNDVAAERSPASDPTTTTTSATTTSTNTSTTTTIATTTTVAPDPHRTIVATARSTVTSLIAYDAPDGELLPLPFVVPNPHQFGGPLTLMVSEGDIGDDWVKVQLPIRPNGTEGWIKTDEYALGETFMRAEVDLANTMVRVYDGDELVAETPAAIGTEETPTPLGTFFVAAKRRNPPQELYLGEWAVILSSFSEVLESFSGGLPVIAIHGTNFPDVELGQALSNGCIRVPNDVMQFLAEHLPLGAPVVVTG